MTTVVTGFYPVKNKYQGNPYIEWSKHFLENIEGPFVIFTSQEYAALFQEYRRAFPNKTKIIVRDFNSYELTSPPMMDYWRSQTAKDPEHSHSPELYAVWALKQEFVGLAIKENPFNSSHFVWADIGILREPDCIPLIKNFPHSLIKKNISGKIILLAIGDNIRGGGILAGNIEAWARFTQAYKENLLSMEKDGIFTGKDQTVYKRMETEYGNRTSRAEALDLIVPANAGTSTLPPPRVSGIAPLTRINSALCMEMSNIFQLVEGKQWFPTKNIHVFDSIWFYLLYYLSH